MHYSLRCAPFTLLFLLDTVVDVQVLNLIPKEGEGESFEDALARVRRCLGGGGATDNADSDSDLEVVTESVTVNLRCPVSVVLHISVFYDFFVFGFVTYMSVPFTIFIFFLHISIGSNKPLLLCQVVLCLPSLVVLGELLTVMYLLKSKYNHYSRSLKYVFWLAIGGMLSSAALVQFAIGIVSNVFLFFRIVDPE